MRLNRRQLLLSASAGSLLTAVGAAALRREEPVTFLSAADTDSGEHCLLGLSPRGDLAYCIAVPQRAHEACALSGDLAMYFARRPGRYCYAVNPRRGELLATLVAEEGQHFCGHGLQSADGRLLYLTAYAYERRMGVVSVHEASAPFRKLAQFDTHGLDPHQLALLPDGNTLVVANGGILTHPTSEREMLNLDTMAPNLVYIDTRSGEILEQVLPPHHQISLRHLAVAPDGTVVIGAQDHAPGIEDHPHPLVFRHRRGEPLISFAAAAEDWRRMRQYIASVALSPEGRFALTTTPRGALASLWDMTDHRLMRQFPVRDAAGAAWAPREESFLVSNGLGQLVYVRLLPEPHLHLATHTPQLHWDNHLTLVS